jgi:hypothetical protein
MIRLCMAALIVLALLGATAGGASSTDHTLQVGDGILVGARVACAVEKAKDGLAVVCLARNPTTGRVYRPSLGLVMIAGKAEKVAIQYYDKRGNVSNIWLRRQPQHSSTGQFRSGKGGKTRLALAGDRYVVGGTNILCPISGSVAILCAVVNTKTLKPVPGTYGIYADGRSVEVDQVTKNGGFKTVKAYNEPPLKG